MPRTAILLNVLIASPSDVRGERDVVTSVVRAWNADHYSTTGIMLNPLGTDNHQSKLLSDCACQKLKNSVRPSKVSSNAHVTSYMPLTSPLV